MTDRRTPIGVEVEEALGEVLAHVRARSICLAALLTTRPHSGFSRSASD